MSDLHPASAEFSAVSAGAVFSMCSFCAGFVVAYPRLIASSMSIAQELDFMDVPYSGGLHVSAATQDN
jgi:hypothetical protein